MSDLAYNLNGESFEVPATATGWRVRRMKQRGAPEVVYGRELGVPLVVPIEADLDELRRNVDAPGRFRLDAVDERGRTIEDLPAAYVMVASRLEAIAAPQPGTSGIGYQTPDSVVAEAMRLNTELAKSVIDRFPEMMHAAAELLRAADGAGLPARQPREVDSDDDDDDEEDEHEVESASPPAFDLNAIVAQIVPILVTSLMSGKMKLPGLAAMFDWRKAQPAKETANEPTPPPKTPNDKAKTKPPVNVGSPASVAHPVSESVAIPPLDAAAMAHVIAIQSVLEPQEVAYVQEVAKELSPAELRTWFDELSKLSVPDAVLRIRGLIAGKTGGAS